MLHVGYLGSCQYVFRGIVCNNNQAINQSISCLKDSSWESTDNDWENSENAKFKCHKSLKTIMPQRNAHDSLWDSHVALLCMPPCVLLAKNGKVLSGSAQRSLLGCYPCEVAAGAMLCCLARLLLFSFFLVCGSLATSISVPSLSRCQYVTVGQAWLKTVASTVIPVWPDVSA